MEYKEGEMVFAYSGPLLYAAKVLKCQHSGGKVEYLYVVFPSDISV